jgi:hypothetical protein
MGAKGRTNPLEVFEQVRSQRVSSLESLSLIITGDSLSLFRKAYFKPEGRGLSTIEGFGSS